MSFCDNGMQECKSCGHIIERGRLTCRNCGASAEVKIAISDIYSYREMISEYNAHKYLQALELLKEKSMYCDSFLVSNIVAEISQTDIFNFYSSITLPIQKENRDIREWKLKPDVRLFQIRIKVDEGEYFDRYVALEGQVLYVCEVSDKAEGHFKTLHYSYMLRKDAQDAPNEIKKFEDEIAKSESLIMINSAIYEEKREQLEKLLKKENNRFSKLLVSEASIISLKKEIDEYENRLARERQLISWYKEGIDVNKRILEKYEKKCQIK